MSTLAEPEETSRLERLPSLVAILVAPGTTMRRILAQERDRLYVPILFLSFLSVLLAGRDERGTLSRLIAAGNARQAVTVIGALIIGAVFFAAMFYLFAWIAAVIGRSIFEGRGSARELRSALAWGATPMIWALLFRLPAAIWLPSKETLGIGDVGDGFLLGVFLLSLEFLVYAACLAISTFTVAVAHAIPAGDALGTVLLTLATPVVVGIAAFIAGG